MTTTTEQQYVRESVGPFTHLWFDPAPAFRPSQTDCKEKNRTIFRNVPIHHAAARVLARKKSVASGSERINRRCPYAVILVWRLRQVSPQVALQIHKHLSQSVADLNLLFLNEFFCNDHWRAHRCGGFTFWPQVILAVRGRHRIRSGSRACTAFGPRTIRAPVADNCVAAGHHRRITRGVPAKNCHRSARLSCRWQARRRNRCGIFRSLRAALDNHLCGRWNYWRYSSARLV